jgi:hypothetical protein
MSPLMCRSWSLSERKGPGLYTTAPRRVRWDECGEWHGGGFQGEGVSRDGVIDTSSLPFSAPGHTQGVTYAHEEDLAMDVVDAGRW